MTIIKRFDRDQEMGTEFKKLETNLSKLSKELVKADSDYKHMKEAVEGELEKAKTFRSNAAEVHACNVGVNN